MTVKELVAELARSSDDADKLVYISVDDHARDIDEVFFYKDAVVIDAK